MLAELFASRQRVIVVSDSWSGVRARMLCLELRNETWIAAPGPFEVTVGTSGMAWGRGLYEPAGDGPFKKEGDRKAPAGVFRLVKAMGYAAAPPAGTTLPYEQITASHHCIDDPASQYYNRVVDASGFSKPVGELWKSSECMKRRDDLYKWLIVVDYNRKEPQPGAGSCIFIHIRRSKEEGTAGCTAMAESDMVTLLPWLKPEHHPLLIQLPGSEYERKRSEWNLPHLEKVG